MNENQKIEIAGETADVIYFEIINELGQQEKEKFVIPDKENTNEKGEIVGTKNTELGSEVYMSIESELISLIKRVIKPQTKERKT
jgi:hypothetical protein